MSGVLLIMQSGGSSPVINATLAGATAEAQKMRLFDAIYGARHGVEGLLGENFVDLTRATNLPALAQTTAAALGGSRHKLQDSDYQRLFEVLRAHNVRYLIQIGGNGSMVVCHRLAQAARDMNNSLQVIGAPKTVDNDIAGTDHTPGYGSAARFIALATRDTGCDLEAMATFDDVSILEAMGRDAGWIAASSALLKDTPDDAPNLVYVPEIPFDEESFLQAVIAIHRKLGRVFVVVGEGLKDTQGIPVGYSQGGAVDSMQRPIYTLGAGVSTYLAARVRDKLGLQTRTLRPGLIGRALTACISEVDRAEAWQVGVEAVLQLSQGSSDVCITLDRLSDMPYESRTSAIPLEQICERERRLPREFMDESGTTVTQAFMRYALPLIGDAPRPLVRLAGAKIPKKLI